VRVVLAAHPPLGFQPVEEPAERRALDLEDRGELGLGGAGIAEEMVQHPPLRAGEAEALHAPVVDDAHQPRHIVHQVAEVARQVLADHVHHFSCPAYNEQGKELP
jgi:hypothetical protein